MTERGKPFELNDVDIEQVQQLVRLALPVETFLDLELVYNHDYFKGKKHTYIQYYYYMLLKRRGFLSEDIDGCVTTTKRLKGYVLRVLVANALDQNLSYKDIQDQYHVNSSFVSTVNRDYKRRTKRRLPSMPEQFEKQVVTNVAITEDYQRYGFDYIQNHYSQYHGHELKLIVSVYVDILKNLL